MFRTVRSICANSRQFRTRSHKPWLPALSSSRLTADTTSQGDPAKNQSGASLRSTQIVAGLGQNLISHLRQPEGKDLNAFFAELSQRYAKKLKVDAVDIDVFAHAISKEEQLDELEHLLKKFRKTRRTKDMLESTHHAVCRSYLGFKALDRLLTICRKPIEYGIFIDHHCANILLSQFIESKNLRDAARVAVLVALQEEFENPITNRLCLYALHRYVTEYSEQQPWLESSATDEAAAGEAKADGDQEGDDEEEELVYVRVPRIRNPFNDDHFDIADEPAVLGKSLYGFGRQFDDDIVGRSCQLLGLAIYNKWDRAGQLLRQRWLNKTDASPALFTKDCLDRVLPLAAALADEHESKQAALGLVRELEAQRNQAPQLTSSDGKTMAMLLDDLLAQIPALEQADHQALSKKFEQWEMAREQALKRQLDELLRDERIKEIELKRRELEERERLLFFFENESKHEMDKAQAEEVMAKLRTHSQVEEVYVPPTVH